MPRGPRTIERFAGGWLRVVSNAVSQTFARQLRASDVTIAEFVLLRILFHTGEALSPGELSRSTGLSKGAVSKLLDRGVRNGLVLRTESKEDRRYQEVRLTRKGKSLVPKLEKLAQNNDDEFLSCLSKSERASLVRLLKKIAVGHRIHEMATD